MKTKIELSTPQVMGILNITPDSFYTASRKQNEEEIAARVRQIVEEGASIIDIGGYSSRPNAAFVSEEEEMQRLRFGLEILRREAPDAVVSVDTFRAEIARECVESYGVAIINDISAGSLDETMFDTAADLQVTYIMMHMRGNPQTMMQDTRYGEFLPEVVAYFREKIARLRERGVKDIWLDPGFGFSKTTAQNYELLHHLELLDAFDLPVLVGVSRKTLIREVLGVSSDEALNGTTAIHAFALTKGAKILRVHDVKEAVQAVKIYNKITQA
jgi:dihydropteroate synthase